MLLGASEGSQRRGSLVASADGLGHDVAPDYGAPGMLIVPLPPPWGPKYYQADVEPTDPSRKLPVMSQIRHTDDAQGGKLVSLLREIQKTQSR